MRHVKEKAISVVLKGISDVAKRNTKVACLGIMYEPEVPAKLQQANDEEPLKAAKAE